MKKTAFALLCALIACTVNAQSYRLNWGEEIKLKKGTSDIDVIAADNSGIYFTESRLRMTSYFVIGATYGESQKLYKFDKNFSEVFEKDYRKEMKGYDFNSFQMLENDLYVFVTDYSKKDKVFKVFGARIDKNSGELMGDFSEFGNYQLESKRESYGLKVTPLKDGKGFLAVSNISGKERVSLGVSILDKNFRKKQDAVIDIPIEPGKYRLADVQLTAGDRIVVLGKEFEETQVGKKKKK